MIPIPLKILNQSCTHKVVTKDNWKVETYETYNITNVYFEPSNELVKTKDNIDVKASSLMVFDNVNSVAKLSGVVSSPNFNYDDIITFANIDYRIMRIDTVYQANNTDIHHYEIYLK